MKKLLAVLVFYVHLFSAYGQVPYFQNYYLQRKSESIHVNAIFQDRAGFLWFGTDKGLFKFNGLSYQHFDVARGLSGKEVTAIAQDAAGNIWIGHKNGRLSYFEGDSIRVFDPPEGPASAEISDILFDNAGNLWFSTLSDGLYYHKNDRLYRLDEDDGMPDLYIYDILLGSQGNIWAGTDRGVAVCMLEDAGVRIDVIDGNDGLPDVIVKKIIQDEQGIFWIATEDAGIVRFDWATKRIESIFQGDWKNRSIVDFVNSGNQVWIASRENGLIVFDWKNQKTKTYQDVSMHGLGSINVLHKDTEGNIWIGSRSGILRTPGDFIEYVEDAEPSVNKNIVAVTTAEGDVWFSNQDGLFRQRKDNTGKHFVTRQLLNTPFQDQIIISLYADDAGYIWAGLYGEGVIRIHPETGKLRHLKNELRNGNILGITGNENAVWLATLGGASRIDIADDELIVNNFSQDNGLASDFVYQVFVDTKDRVWFGTDGRGVVMLDNTGNFHHYEDSLSSNAVYGFAEDGLGDIWANVQGDGLYKFNGKGFYSAEKIIPLRDKNVAIFTSDNHGNLVVMHDLGLDLYDVQHNRIRYLGEEVGIRDMVPNLNATSRDKDGAILLGTDEGILKYNGIKVEEFSNPVPHIDLLRVLNRNVVPSEKLGFNYNEDNITIYYTGLWFRDPANVHFLYTLENYNKEWIASRDLSATYSSLLPGSYTFRLKVSDTADFSNSKESTITFVISPPFWRTTGFYFFSIGMAIVLGYSYVKYREQRLVKDKKILQEKVEERTFDLQKKTVEAQTQSEEIQAQNEEIMAQAEEIKGINENLELLVKERTAELERKNKALEEYAFINAHQLRAPLASILGLINLVSRVDLPEKDREIIERLRDSAEKLEAIVRDITVTIEKSDRKRDW